MAGLPYLQNPAVALMRLGIEIGKYWYTTFGSQKILGWGFLFASVISCILVQHFQLERTWLCLVLLVIFAVFGLAIAVYHPENENDDGETLRVSFPFDSLSPGSTGYERESLLHFVMTLSSALVGLYPISIGFLQLVELTFSGNLTLAFMVGSITPLSALLIPTFFIAKFAISTVGVLALGSLAMTTLYMNISGGRRVKNLAKQPLRVST